jgi:hypothetical protein
MQRADLSSKEFYRLRKKIMILKNSRAKQNALEPLVKELIIYICTHMCVCVCVCASMTWSPNTHILNCGRPGRKCVWRVI